MNTERLEDLDIVATEPLSEPPDEYWKRNDLTVALDNGN